MSKISIVRRKLSFFSLFGVSLALAVLFATACSDDITTITRSTTTAPAATSTTSESAAQSTTTAQPRSTGGIVVQTTTPPPADSGDSDTTSASTTTSPGTPDDPENEGAETEASPPTTYELGETAFDSRSRVTTVGIGDIYFGDWFRDAEAAARTEWVGIPDGTMPECLVVTPVNGPEGVEVWLWRGYVERVDITDSDIRTRSGYGVGTSLDSLQEALGDRLQETANDDGTTTAEFVPADPGDAVFRIVFEVSAEGDVTSYRSGRATLINTTKEDCD